MKKKKLEINLSKKYIKEQKKKVLDCLEEPLRTRFKKSVKLELYTLKEHFKKDKYDLNFNLIKDDILYNSIGVSLGDYIIYSFIENGYELISDKKGLMVTRK